MLLKIRVSFAPDTTLLHEIVKAIQSTESHVDVLKPPPPTPQGIAFSGYEAETVLAIVGAAGGAAGVAQLILSIFDRKNSKREAGKSGSITVIIGDNNLVVNKETNSAELQRAIEKTIVFGNQEAVSEKIRALERNYKLEVAQERLRNIIESSRRLTDLIDAFRKGTPLAYTWQKARFEGYKRQLREYEEEKMMLERLVRTLENEQSE